MYAIEQGGNRVIIASECPAGERDSYSAHLLLAGVALAALALGLALLPLQRPWFTRELSARTSQASEAGLSAARMAEVAEQVRAFVVDGDGDLPETVDGHPGFDPAAASHLADVADVLEKARWVTGLLAGALMVWLAIAVFTRRTAAVASALRLGAIVTAVGVMLGGVVAATSFDAFFTAFHGLFFASGTWTFPYDSLLIRTFPEPFWTSAGIAWAVCSLLVAGAYAGLAALLGRSGRADAPTV
ncbi:MAG: DUF1461 domain-containing protein [Actinobacteria bacterium]|nr:MAG: DUF1461 domain-containing protein [Actinomycetota bacterium]